MILGTQLHAPSGFGALARGVVYHFLRSDSQRLRVMLVTFGASTHSHECEAACSRPVKPELLFMRRNDFENAVEEGSICQCGIQRELPHWFGSLTIAALRDHGKGDETRQRPHRQRMDEKVDRLRPAIDRLEAILSADDPAACLNAIAKSCHPVQHVGRFRMTFFAYVCFGMSRWALHYPIGQLGTWDRRAHDKKLGRPSVLGSQHGYSSCSDEIQALCIEGYRRFSGPRVTMRIIYRRTMINVFECEVKSDATGRYKYVQPQGKPIVSEGQFAYRVNQHFSLRTRQITKYGEARTRNRLQPSQGRFTDAVGNLMEVVEADVYFVDEVARGFDHGAEAPRLAVACMKCVTSGMLRISRDKARNHT